MDGALIRIRESRYFHIFDTDAIYLDVVWEELFLHIPPSECPSPKAATSSTTDHISRDVVCGDGRQITQAELDILKNRISKDAKLQCDANMLSKMLPVINEQENIPKHYIIRL